MKRSANKAALLGRVAKEERARDIAFIDAMWANKHGERPLKPPPMRLMPPTISAAQLELRKFRRLGLAA